MCWVGHVQPSWGLAGSGRGTRKALRNLASERHSKEIAMRWHSVLCAARRSGRSGLAETAQQIIRQWRLKPCQSSPEARAKGEPQQEHSYTIFYLYSCTNSCTYACTYSCTYAIPSHSIPSHPIPSHIPPIRAAPTRSNLTQSDPIPIHPLTLIDRAPK